MTRIRQKYPNLQQLSLNDPIARRLKELFREEVAKEMALVEVDYTDIEQRILSYDSSHSTEA